MTHMTVADFQQRAEAEQAQFLDIMVTAYHNMGERTLEAIGRRAGVSEADAQRVMYRLRERELAYSTHPVYGQQNGWHLTEAGWEAANANPPAWMQWARKPQESTT